MHSQCLLIPTPGVEAPLCEYLLLLLKNNFFCKMCANHHMTHLYGALTTWKTLHLVPALGESEARPGTLAAMVVSSPNLASPAPYSVNKYSRGVCNVPGTVRRESRPCRQSPAE